MDVARQIEELHAAESHRRSLAWVDLVLPLCGLPVRPITARAMLELQLVGNAFACGGPATWEAAFGFFWRLHPAYGRPGTPGRLRRAWHRARLAWGLRRHSMPVLASAIRERLLEAYLDAPGAVTAADNHEASPLAARYHWVDSLVDWYITRYGSALGHPLDLPLAQLFQLRRSAGLLAGEEVIDPVAPRIAAALHAVTKK